MATEAIQFLLLLLLISLLSAATSAAITTQSIRSATASLTNSGHTSMALTLEFASRNLLPTTSPSLTIFSPPDAAFADSGQPSLSLLHFHFSPLSLSPSSLQSLRTGYTLPTLFPNHSLTVTSLSPNVSLNGVPVNSSSIYDDGALVIFATEGFFDPDFSVSNAVNDRDHDNDHSLPSLCRNLEDYGNENRSFSEAIGALRSRGSGFMAACLDLQLKEFGDGDQALMTIFAPLDKSLKPFATNFSLYRSVFFRHIAPCRITGTDLVNFDGGMQIPTYLEEYDLRLEKSGDKVMLNGVRVSDFGFYTNTWLVVHGLDGSFKLSSSSSRIVNKFLALKVLLIPLFYSILLCCIL